MLGRIYVFATLPVRIILCIPDSYVKIACGGTTKINSANAVSRDCLINTITNLVGVDIDYYVEVNFQGVVDIVDAIGGITVNSPVEFVGQTASTVRGTKTVWVPAGQDVPLNGAQALAFARERYAFASGDFARQEHQQQVIEAMVTKILRTRDINTFLKILDAAGNNIKTNISVDQMTAFMKYALQKSNRLYDKDHVERVFDIITSRVTGYSSGLWDPGMEIVLYIYRLYQGSLTDTRNFINRNINMTTPINRQSMVEWSVNWDVASPVISAQAYNEAIIPSDVPPEVLEKDAEEQGCAVNASWNGNTCECNGGFTGDGYTECKPADAEPEETEAPKCADNAYYNENKGACVCNDGYSSSDPNTVACKVDATPTPTATPTQEATPTPATPTPTPATPTPEQTQTCWDGSVIPVSQACPAQPTPTPEQTQTCWDGSVIPVSQACPADTRVTCWDGSVALSESACPAQPTPEPQPENTPNDNGGGEGGEGGEGDGNG